MTTARLTTAQRRSWPVGLLGCLTVVLNVLVSCAPAASPPAPANAPAAGKPAPASGASAPSSTGAAAPAASTAATPPAPISIRTSYASPSGSVIPIWVAFERGLFRQQGLDMELVLLSGTRSDQGVVTGDAPIGYGANVLPTKLSGADIVAVAGVANRISFTLFTKPGVGGRPEDLRQKIIATTPPGSASTSATLLMLRHFGLDASRDVQIQPTAGTTEAMTLVAQGLADATLLTPPITLKAVELGLVPQLRLADLGVPFMQTAIGTSQAFMGSNPEAVRRYLRGYIQGVALARSDPEFAKAMLGKYTQTEDAPALEETYSYFREVWGKPDFRVQPEAVAAILGVLDHPGAPGAKADDFIDNRFVDELERSGFIRESGALN